DVPVSRPGPAEVLVKVESAALNPIEWNIKGMDLFIEKYPAILGADAAGVDEEVGENVKTLASCSKVFFEPRYGNFKQSCLVPVDITTKIPANLSLDQAAAIPVAMYTAVLGMYNQHSESASAHLTPPWGEAEHPAYAGKPVFILGGSLSVGQCVIQMAKLSEFSSIVTTASPSNASLLTSLGATHVLDRNLPAEALMAQLSGITGGAPISFVYDAISLPETQVLAYTALSPGGTLVLTFPKQLPSGLEQTEDRKTVVEVFASLYVPQNRETAVAMFRQLSGWLETGVLKPNHVEVLPGGLAAIPAGLERIKSNGISATKLVVHPEECA
ncbi:GroES-like protein, partial [Cerioporus squamosus]